MAEEGESRHVLFSAGYRLPRTLLLLEGVRSDRTFRFSSQTFSPASLIHGRFVSGHDLQTCRTERI